MSYLKPEAWIHKVLATSPDVSALVETRIFPPRVPQEAITPYITYQRKSTQREPSLSLADGLPKATLLVMCWTLSSEGGYVQSLEIADAVRRCIDARRIEETDHSIDYTALVNEYDAPVGPVDGDDLFYHCRALEVEIHYQEEVNAHP